MIYTVTVNPSLDYIVSVDDFKLGLTNRSTKEQLLPGGKGINVSMVLSNLGFTNIALGFVAGFIGEEIIRKLEDNGVKEEFIRLKEGNSRINIKLRSIDGTEINASGPVIDEESIEELLKRLEKLEDGDTLILSGSIPDSVSKTFYKEIMDSLQGKNVLTVVDATNELLMNVLPYHPFLIKPNNHELGEIFNVKLTTKEEVVPYAKKLQEMGAKNVLVSMSKQGAVLVAENGEVIIGEAPDGKLVNAVGAGDSMVAGFIAGWLEKHNYEYAYRMGASAGSASAFSDYLATKEEILDVYNRTYNN